MHIKQPDLSAFSGRTAILELDALAAQSALIASAIKGSLQGEPFECTVICKDYYDSGTKYSGIVIDSKKHGLWTSADTIGSAMLHAAEKLEKADINWDSLWVKTSKCGCSRKEVVELVRQAWHESFGRY